MTLLSLQQAAQEHYRHSTELDPDSIPYMSKEQLIGILDELQKKPFHHSDLTLEELRAMANALSDVSHQLVV